MSCCSSITDVLKSIIKSIAPIVSIALMAFAVYAIFLAGPGVLACLQGISWLPTGILTMQASTLGYLALGASLIISPETVTGIANTVATAIGSVAGTVVAGVTGGLASGLLGSGDSSILGYAALAAVAYFLLTRKRDTEESEAASKPRSGVTSESPLPGNPSSSGDMIYE